MANSHPTDIAAGDQQMLEGTATNCVTALDNLIRLSKMGAATHEAVTHLQGLADLCGEANKVIAEIKTGLADSETVEDPVRMAEVLTRLAAISQAVQDANERTDDRILQFNVAAV